MPPSSTTLKYGFRIRTRNGPVVEHLMIHGRDESDAERKLRQIYRHCEILERRVLHAAATQPEFAPRARQADETPGETVSNP